MSASPTNAAPLPPEQFDQFRIRLGREIAEEAAGPGNSAEAGRIVTEKENQALILSAVASGKSVPERHLKRIIREFAAAKRMWVMWELVLRGLLDVAVERGQVRMTNSDVGRKLLERRRAPKPKRPKSQD